LDDIFQLGVQNYLSYYRQLVLNGLMESLHLDIFGQAVVQLVLDDSQEHVVRHLQQERASVRDGGGLGTTPEEGRTIDTGNPEPLETDPAVFAMIESHLHGLTYHTEHGGALSQQPRFDDISDYPVEGPPEQPLHGDYLNVSQPIMVAPEPRPYLVPLQDNSETSKQLDALTAWDEDYVFQS
jgi:hypothetical protein